jgi:hypothetical protein
MREIRTSGSMSGEWKRSTVGYSGTGNRKGRQHARPHLNHRATPRLYSNSGPDGEHPVLIEIVDVAIIHPLGSAAVTAMNRVPL